MANHTVQTMQRTNRNQKRNNQMAKNPDLVRREEIVINNRLRIGHTRIAHGFLVAREDSPICSACGTKLSVRHIISDCLKCNRNRIEHKNLDASLGPQLPAKYRFN